MGTKKITLAPNSPTNISPDRKTGMKIEWCIDPKLNPVIVDHSPDCLRLLLDDDHLIPSGFYAVDVIYKSIDNDQQIERQAYLIRATMGSASGVLHKTSPQASNPAVISTDPITLSSGISPAQEDFGTSESQTPISSDNALLAGSQQQVLNTGPAKSSKKISAKPINQMRQQTSDIEMTICDKIPPPLQGFYELAVCRNGMAITGAEVETLESKTIIIGKDPMCSLPLNNYFTSDELARKCSRRQLEVFWHEKRICVKNIGTNSVVVTASPPYKLRKDQWGYWSENTMVELPCGLSIQLRKKKS